MDTTTYRNSQTEGLTVEQDDAVLAAMLEGRQSEAGHGAEVATWIKIVCTGKAGHADWMSGEGFDRMREWHHAARLETKTNRHDWTNSFAVSMEPLLYLAMTRPETGDDLVFQMTYMLDSNFIDREFVRHLLFSAGVERFTALQQAWRLYRSGMPATKAAAEADAPLSTFQKALLWLGAEQARKDRQLDAAIVLVEDGATPSEVARALGVSSGHASKLTAAAKSVLAELAA